MEYHESCLQDLCRICGKKITLKAGYLVPKTCADYHVVLVNFYGINVHDEAPGLFPKKLCGTCRRKLEKLKCAAVPSDMLESAKFEVHTENCSICFKTNFHPANQHMKVFDTKFKEIGFQKIDLESSYRRQYCLFDARNVSLSKLTVCIKQNYAMDVFLYGREIDTKQNNHLKQLPSVISDTNIAQVIEILNSSYICTGITDFEDVIRHRLHVNLPFVNDKGESIAVLENVDHTPLIPNDFTVIRHKECELIVSDQSTFCSACSSYVAVLRVWRSRISSEAEGNIENKVSDSSHTNLRYLSNDELISRLKNTQKMKQHLTKKVSRLTALVHKSVEIEGIQLTPVQGEFFSNILTTAESFEEDSPQWLLWNQQKEQANKADKRGMRWHPLIVRWCLSIYHTSPAAYKQMTNVNLGFLHLPHVNTLKKFTRYTTPTTGFNVDIIKRLVEDAELGKCEEYKKNVVLSFDEMKIKSNLLFRKSTGQMVGFTELGDINDELVRFNANIESSNEHADEFARDFATRVNMFMVRGIFSHLAYPMGYFATKGISGDQLYACAMEAVRILESVSFKVRAITADGASQNRKLFKILAAGTHDTDFYWTKNPFDHNRVIFFISDVPHLLKTTRNCLENSHGNNNTRNMHYEKQDISWNHVVNVYEWDLGMHRAAMGLHKLHKIREEHIHLTSRLRMQVALAAQVLSKTMADCLEIQGLHNTKSTIKFIRIFDRVFDCLNVSRLHQDARGKTDLAPYTSPDDYRFQFLKEEFLLNYLGKWNAEARNTVGISEEERGKLQLSKQTVDGWKYTVNSFVDLAQNLLQEEEVVFLLSEKFSQDPLEEHFGRQCRRGGCNDNPTLLQFGDQELALNVMKSELITDLCGNTQGKDKGGKRKILDIHDVRELPKAKKRSTPDC